MSQPLAYASVPLPNDRIRVEHSADGSVTITVATRRSPGRYFKSWINIDLYVVLLAPILFPVAWLIFKYRATRKPRAIIRITPEEFILIETSDDDVGTTETTASWPLAKIGELRPNRYDPGLY